MASVAGKAVINIMPSMKGFKASVNSELDGISAHGSKVGSKLTSALKGAAIAGAAAIGAAVVKIGKDAVAATAQFEQLEGGVNKLFGNSAKTVMSNAQNAFKTAGMSANQYMDNVMKFSASLIQSVGGDTVKAAKIADMAVKDMADNVNTFGSNVEDVQNAYQGFAKQNYTMLDNLRLGYGGTKSEMERLLKDAEKISGVKYDVSNFADVTQAIHVMQEAMAITGTTAQEAANTVEGAWAQTKGSWDNLLVAIGTGKNVDKAFKDFIGSVKNLGKNIGPIVLNIGKSMIDLIKQGIASKSPTLAKSFDNAFTSLKKLGKTIADFFTNPSVQAALSTIADIFAKIAGFTFDVLAAAFDVIAGLIEAIVATVQDFKDRLHEIANSPAVQLIKRGVEIVAEKIGEWVDKIRDVRDWIKNKLQPAFQPVLDVISSIGDAFSEFVSPITDAIDKVGELVDEVLELFGLGGKKSLNTTQTAVDSVNKALEKTGRTAQHAGSTTSGAFNNIANNARSANTSISTSSASAATSMKNSYTAAGNSTRSVASGIQSAFTGSFGAVKTGAVNTANQIPNAFGGVRSGVSSKIGSTNSIGTNMVAGIKNGISSQYSSLVSTFTATINAAKNAVQKFLKIKSPSRLMRDVIGKNIMLGIAAGIEAEETTLSDTFKNSVSSAVDFMPATSYTADYAAMSRQTQAGVKVVNQTVNLYETNPAAVAAVLEQRQEMALRS